MLKEKEDDFYLFIFLTDEDIRIFLSIWLYFFGIYTVSSFSTYPKKKNDLRDLRRKIKLKKKRMTFIFIF